MKRKFGIVAVAALSTMAFSQLVLADSYDFWTANTPKRAETQTASSKVVPVGSKAASVSTGSYDFWLEKTPKRAGS